MDRLVNSIGDGLVTGTALTAAAALFGTITVLSVALYRQRHQVQLIRSPAFTLLPHLSAKDRAALDYPPDVFPGGRDVRTPYGVMKVYEWGPETGQKVLLVHGITTTCLSLGAIAHRLVDRGYRVMLYDLWGRGYSDCPADLPHDERLYSSQILFAITSSPLSWSSSDATSKFKLVGYSLGGGIAATFTSQFSTLVESLVLISPTGLIRKERGTLRKGFRVVSRLIPNSLLNPMLRKFLSNDLIKNGGRGLSPAAAQSPEAWKPQSQLSRAYPKVTILTAGLWHIRLHQGLIDSFKSTIRYGPLFDRQEAYRLLGKRETKTLVFAGSDDGIICAQELEPDIKSVVGKDKIVFKLMSGAHDIPCTHPEEIVDNMHRFWIEGVIE